GNPQACPAQCSRDRRGGLERLRGIGHNGASRPARSPTRYRFAYGGALARSRRPDFERGGRVGMWTVMNQTGAPSANDTWRTSAPSGPERPRMQRHRPLRRRVPVWLAVTMLALAACAPAAQAPQSAVRAGGPAASAVPQRALVIAYPREPVALEPSLLPQNREESALASAFLAYFTPQQQAAPYLAEELPSVDKGTWKIFSDGTMETTYKLRSNARWHDG